jgi:uncharacterized membrane protein
VNENIEEINAYLQALNTRLVLVGARRRHRILSEVEDHLRQATEEAVVAGTDLRSAAVAAITRFGPPGEMAGRIAAKHLGCPV